MAHKWSARMIVAAIDKRLAADAGRASRVRTWSPAYA